MRALSIRQPYAEQILRGTKRFEYRSRRTAIRERVYILRELQVWSCPRVQADAY